MTASNDLLSGNPAIEGRPNRPRFIAHALDFVAPLPQLSLFAIPAQAKSLILNDVNRKGLHYRA
jgi:hypothetical protein